MPEKLNKKFKRNKFVSILLSGRLWLTLLLTLICLICTSKYYIVKTYVSGVEFYGINYYIFSTIAALCILITYPVFSYLCNLKTKENKSLSDILLTSVFFVLLLVPASKINSELYSDTEKRALAHRAHLFNAEMQINNNFGKDFEKWFNDRFFTRNFLIVKYQNIIRLINRNYNTNRAVINKKEGFFFFKREIRETYDPLDVNKLERIKNNLIDFNEFCEDNGIKLYFVIIPDKANIYRELVPFHILKGQKTSGETVFEYVNKNGKQNFLIYPEKEFLDAKAKYNERLFFATDNHMTPFGGYIAYRTVMKALNADFPDIPIVNLNEFSVEKSKYPDMNEAEKEYFILGNENDSTLSDESFLNYEYKYYRPKSINGKPPVRFSVYDNPYLLKSRCFNPDGRKKTILLGSSFLEQSKIFFGHSFKDTDKIRINTAYEKNFHLDRFYPYLKTEKPDIVIVMISEFEAGDYILSMFDKSIELEP